MKKKANYFHKGCNFIVFPIGGPQWNIFFNVKNVPWPKKVKKNKNF